jgi:hypothetical protein
MTVFEKVGTPMNKNYIVACEVVAAVTANGIVF